MYLYGLVHRSAIEMLAISEINGIAGDLSWRESGELAAIVEEGFPAQACANSEAALIEAIVSHDRILLSVFAIQTILPLRFGTEFASEQALIQHLEKNQIGYLRAIDALKNKAEISLKLSATQSAPEPIPSELKGREYFLAKKEQSQQQQFIEQYLDRDRALLLQQLSDRGIQMFEKTVDHYLLLCDRNFDLESSLEHWQAEMGECDRTNQSKSQSKNQWIWKISEELPPYHFSGKLLNLVNDL